MKKVFVVVDWTSKSVVRVFEKNEEKAKACGFDHMTKEENKGKNIEVEVCWTNMEE